MFKHLKTLQVVWGLTTFRLGESTVRMEGRLGCHKAVCPGSGGHIKFCSGVLFWGALMLPTSQPGNERLLVCQELI